jgi:hypothetical protein
VRGNSEARQLVCSPICSHPSHMTTERKLWIEHSPFFVRRRERSPFFNLKLIKCTRLPFKSKCWPCRSPHLVFRVRSSAPHLSSRWSHAQIRSALRWVKISKPHRDYSNSRTTTFVSGSTLKSRTVAASQETCPERKTPHCEETTTTQRKPIKPWKRPAKDSIVCVNLQLKELLPEIPDPILQAIKWQY